jgi:hypothetical protein
MIVVHHLSMKTLSAVPNQQGLWASIQALGGVGIVASAMMMMGWTQRMMTNHHDTKFVVPIDLCDSIFPTW